jgi:hypothetical protein
METTLSHYRKLNALLDIILKQEDMLHESDLKVAHLESNIVQLKRKTTHLNQQLKKERTLK